MNRDPQRATRTKEAALLLGVCLLLATITTTAWIEARSAHYLNNGGQLRRHENVLKGEAGNPWQYRVLTAWMVEGTIRVMRAMDAPAPNAAAFMTFRFVQDLLMFLAAIFYYRKLGIGPMQAILGAMLLAWGASYAHYDSDLQFNTFFDVFFYLLAGTAIVSAQPLWIVPITLFAALNRETSGLIPVLCYAAAYVAGKIPRRKAAVIAGIGLAIYTVIFFALRFAYPTQDLIIPYGQTPGLVLFFYNVMRPVTWWQLLLTLGVIPIVALAGYRTWTSELRAFFWTLVPLWMVIHFFGAVVAESRLFLVPQALILIPGALLYAQQERVT
jgi:hypothetical protein